MYILPMYVCMYVCGTRSNLLVKYHYEGGGGSEREKRGKGNPCLSSVGYPLIMLPLLSSPPSHLAGYFALAMTS